MLFKLMLKILITSVIAGAGIPQTQMERNFIQDLQPDFYLIYPNPLVPNKEITFGMRLMMHSISELKRIYTKYSSDSQGYVNFNDLLYETIRFAFVKKIFKEGSTIGKT